jgi:primosomal protein N' (replication factor Y) (superfamily II helicase)
MAASVSCVQVAVFAPLRQLFDYLPPAAGLPPQPVGCRVKVPFGRGERIGIIVGTAPSAHADDRLKQVIDLLDATALLEPSLVSLARWAAAYYCHPVGEALGLLLPVELRHGEVLRRLTERGWLLADAGRAALVDGAVRIGPRQRELLQMAQAQALRAASLRALPFDTGRVVGDLQRRGWLLETELDAEATPALPRTEFLALNEAQAASLADILARRDSFAPLLLQGVTGSGKTEVYLHAAREMLAGGRQVLMLIPEIGLSEQLVQRFRLRFGDTVAVLHSELTERERSLVWERARRGAVGIVLGTRSAVWAPLPRLGLIIVDEEHDPSFKQQEGFRYSARDVAVMRARDAQVPIVLGSATPSLESELNVRRGRYARLLLPSRAGGAAPPTLHGLDVRGLKLHGGLSETLCAAIDERLARDEQTLLFLNRRGYAPVLMCHACGHIAQCARCDARLVLHQGRERLICHHCGTEQRLDVLQKACCDAPEYFTLGVGTEQVEQALRERFPAARVLRIDRDTMRRKGELEAAYAAVRERRVDILIGTQMLAKGHDFPAVTLVGIVDADSRLFAADFRAGERFAQTLLQVAGRAGRANAPGVVLIQTHHPVHPLLQLALRHDYAAFADAALAEREAAMLPPYVSMAVVRAEAVDARAPLGFLQQLRRALDVGPDIDIAGPVPAPMERRAGKTRAVLMLTGLRRAALADALERLIAAANALPTRHRVRWHIDVDPQEAA